MKQTKLTRVATTIAVLLFCLGGYAQNSEHVLSFHSNIIVQEDGSIRVTETIKVVATGNQIQHGIYRDLPLETSDTGTLIDRATLEIESVRRNNDEEPYHINKSWEKWRVYVGDEEVYIPHGEHTYEITYISQFQLGYFEEFDELYWNATGNAWEFPIMQASATVHLPDPLTADDLRVYAYTGPEGAKGQDYKVAYPSPGVVHFETTRPLAAQEGITLAVGFPKGVVVTPDTTDRIVTLIAPSSRDYAIMGAVALLLVYFLVAWAAVGRDPMKGRINIAETPPEGVSPAAARFVQRMGDDDTTFSAAIFSMAIKGYLRIEAEDDDTFYLVRDEAGPEVLSPDERACGEALFQDSQIVALKKSNRTALIAAKTALTKALAKEYKGSHFKTNGELLALGFAFGAIAYVWSAFRYNDPMPALFLAVWLSIWSLVVAALIGGAISVWIGLFRGTNGVGAAIGATLFAGVFGIFEVVALGMLVAATSVWFAISVMLLGVLCGIFAFLLKAPTSLGRRLMDRIEGFNMWLKGEGVGDAAREARTEAVFERYLPYAIALDSQNEWSEQFKQALASSTTPPRWYQSPTWRPGAYPALATVLPISLSSAVASASASSSSGSGGGGSSGGGGGGGGGGGW